MAGTGVGKFSSTASNNTSNLTVNFAENMAPSNVNNAARELMGHMRDMYEQLGDGYFEFGDGDGTYTVTRGDADTITITGTGDITSVYYVGRKIRITDGGGNVVEGVISASSHSSTTQTIDLTGITLASGTPTKVELGIDTAAFGGKVILDDDGDTYIEAPTDDTIDIYVAGAKDFVITANTFTAESGSTITGPTVVGSTSIQTPLIEFTDGDNAISIADGGGVTFPIASTFTSGFTSNDGVTITTADVNPQLTIISTEAGGDVAPLIDLYRNSSTPADGDVLGQLRYYGENSADEKIEYVRVRAGIADVTDGDEGGTYTITSYTAGAQYGRLNIQETATIFNENSADIDFRVESNGNDHMIFVDGGNDHVNIGGSTDAGGLLNVFGKAIFKASDNSDNIELLTTDGDANAGPNLRFYRNSSSPADGDTLGVIESEGRNDNSQDVIYAQIRTITNDVTDGVEDGELDIKVMNNGSLNLVASFSGPETVINDASIDHNFRVESNGDANCLFVDGGANSVYIGKNSSDGLNSKLQVEAVDSSSAISIHRGSADVAGPGLYLSSSRGASLNDDTIVQDGDTLGSIAAFGADGTDRNSVAASISFQVDGTPGGNDMPGRIVFNTTLDGGVTQHERMRITNAGKVGIGTTAPVHKLQVNDGVADVVFRINNTNTSGNIFGQLINFSYAPDNNTSHFIYGADTVANRFFIYSDGDIQNHDNSYGALSDERIKQDIRDSNSQWDDIKAVKVRNFKKKDDVRQYGDNAWEQIGVVAQELEAVSPKLIKHNNPTSHDIISSSEFGTLYTSDDAETQDAVLYTSDDQEVIDGEKNVGDIKTPSTAQIGEVKTIAEQVKSVNYSILYMKAIKALQEAMTRIETLETKVAALEG